MLHERRIPEWLRHAPAPSVRGFALLAGTEAIARGVLISVFPLAMYKALQDASLVSEAYFLIGFVSLVSGLMVPYVTRFVPRRWVYILSALMYAGGALLATNGTASSTVLALAFITIATVALFVCFNAYVLDYISKIQLGSCETSRMFYGALGWTIGPVLGVFLYKWWEPAPFIISAIAAFAMLGLFLFMRLGNGRLITKARANQKNPVAFLPRFFEQPRLLTGWIFAVLRSSGWWVYVVYLPIYAIENGLGDQFGGIALSVTNATLLVTPFMLKWMQRTSVRYAVRTGFLVSGLMFITASLFYSLPWFAVGCMLLGSFFMILLDVSAGLPFLLAVKPSERTEMSAIYSSYRDVSGILTPGAAWAVLAIAPLSGIFLASGLGLVSAWALANRLHPRLGEARISYAGTESPSP